MTKFRHEAVRSDLGVQRTRVKQRRAFELLGTASLTGFVVFLLGIGLVGPGLAALLVGSLSTVKVRDVQ